MKPLISFAALLLAATVQSAEQPRSVDQAFDRYATVAERVTLPGGRTLNLDCRGAGKPTVLLFAGLTAWSEVWAKVHEQIAEHHRACAFDPAGFGFSGASPDPQDAAHIVSDLEAALTAARIKGPFVVVGHSAGGLQALTFADRHKRDTVGMVLVDPSYPGIFADFDRVAPNMSRFFYGKSDGQKAAFAQCANALAKEPIAPSDPGASVCFVYRPQYSDTLRAALAAAETPSRMRTKIAQIDGFSVASRQTVDPLRNYGAMPLVVLTRGNLGPPPGGPPPGMPAEQAEEGAASDRAWVSAHEALAKLSVRGEHRTVDGAGHMIQLDKPQAVITAIEDVAKAAAR